MRHIAIVGGGFSGALQAVQLLRQSEARVTLIERTRRVARGVAYSTRHAEHLLNVRAAAMSAFPDEPDHFARWLEQHGGTPGTFAERRLYGRYVEELLSAETSERLTVLEGEAVDIARQDGTEQVRLADGASVTADSVILSIGNLEPEVPRGIDPEALGDLYVSDPWAGDITAGLTSGDTILLIGTGLTAIDAALMLASAGFGGKIVALSRRGLLPRAHAEPAPPPTLERDIEPRCTALLRSVREQSERIGWRAAVDQLRPVTQRLWASAPSEERRRFLKHLRPWWDVHRHRIAPQIAERIQRMEDKGRLTVEAGKLLNASADGVRWRPRGSAEPRHLRVARIVNCTGPRANIAHSDELLLVNLLKSGRIRPDVCRIGIDVDADNRVIDAAGDASDSLLAIGPMTRGAWWEIVAVPDIRVQVAQIARSLR